ncbi:MAG TPA: YitT family protein [Bacilli bacterium]|nr:YitT family protein [Bacilli bacterium]
MNKIILKKYFNFVIGVLLVAVTFNLFFLHNNLTAFGISGLAIIVNKTFGVAPSLFILLGNLALIVVSYIFLGKDYTKKTILGALLFPLFVKITAFIPNYIDISKVDLLAVAIVGGALTGIGSGLIYRENFGTAGTDIVDAMIHKYFKVTMGTAVILGDGFVVLCGGIAFGIETMIYSLITLIIISVTCNKVMLGINRTKTFFIVTKKEQKIKNFIMKRLHSDVTIIDGAGGYDENAHQVLMANVDTKQYTRLKNGVNRIDKKAFVAVTDSYEACNKNISIKNKKP